MKSAVLVALIALIIAFATVGLWSRPHTDGQAAITTHDTYLDRVEARGTVRCGYVDNPPFVHQDPNTHAVSGIMVDMTAKLADIIGWKVVWSGETTYPTMAEDLAKGSFDVFCGGSWPIALAEKRQWWAGPLFYSGIGAFARLDDQRFGDDFDLTKLNDPAYSISVIDGVAVDRVRLSDFPQAKAISLPNTTSYGEMITQVTTGKADVVLIEMETADAYIAQNPGKIHRIGGTKPLRLFGIGYEFSYDAPRLRNVFVTAMQEALSAGMVDKILDANETVPGMFYRVKSPAAP